MYRFMFIDARAAFINLMLELVLGYAKLDLIYLGFQSIDIVSRQAVNCKVQLLH